MPTNYNKTKRVCVKCGDPAKIWDKNAWWCAINTSMGIYNMTGYCRKQKQKEKLESNND
jgi:hypothetical protein